MFRITVPTTLFRQGKNVLAIGLAPSVECKELTFDVTMRYAGHGISLELVLITR